MNGIKFYFCYNGFAGNWSTNDRNTGNLHIQQLTEDTAIDLLSGIKHKNCNFVPNGY